MGIVTCLFTLSCASLSKSPNACEEAVKNELYPKPISIFVDFILFRDCSFSKNLRYESGEYYHKNKKRIMEEIDGQWDNLRYVGYLGELFGCKREDAPDFKNFLLKNRVEIFGSAENETPPRKVMLNIGNLINNDEALKDKCK
jgi:hypothetical protein